MKRAITKVYEELKGRANKIGLNIRVKKKKTHISSK
jgi:hypothetical protein